MKKTVCKTVVSVLFCAGLIFPAMTAAESINWNSYDKGVALGKKQQKKVLLHFYAGWCGYCRKMAKDTFQNPKIVSYINKHFVPVRVDIDKDRKTSAMYGVRGVPATWFLTETGKGIDQITGYVASDQFMPVLKKVNALPAEKVAK